MAGVTDTCLQLCGCSPAVTEALIDKVDWAGGPSEFLSMEHLECFLSIRTQKKMWRVV